MDEIIALIGRIIDEHRIITGTVRALEQAATDAEAMAELEEAKEVFMPGRLEKKAGLQKLQELLETTDSGLQAHFSGEETGLLGAFEKYGSKELASALRSLLLGHEDLRNRFAHLKKLVNELTAGGLSRQVWEASAYDMRAYLNQTRRQLEVHAETEQELLQKLRAELNEKREGK